MNIEGLEVKKNKKGTPTYWKDDILVGKKCTKCGKDKEMSEFNFRNKKKRWYTNICKECGRERDKKRFQDKHEQELERFRRYNKIRKRNKRQKTETNISDRVYFDNEKMLEVRINGKGGITYWKDGVMVAKRCLKCNEDKNISEFSIRNKKKNSYSAHCKKCVAETSKIWRETNEEYFNKINKEAHIKRKTKNILKLTEMLEQINPILKGLNLKAFGRIYKITNTKTGRVYIGQSTNNLNIRYNGEMIKTWIKERQTYNKQKFLEELIEEDFKLEEAIAVGVCKYHLDKLEAYYINKYDSYNNGYNNQEGNHITTDGIEEFNQILSDHNLEFKDGKLTQIKAPTQK